MTQENTKLIAYCGLYCGTCGSYKKGKCKSCKDDGGFSRCKVRKCCIELHYQTCAEYGKLADCKTLDNFISKIFAMVFHSNRKGNLKQIREMGLEKWVEERTSAAK